MTIVAGIAVVALAHLLLHELWWRYRDARFDTRPLPVKRKG